MKFMLGLFAGLMLARIISQAYVSTYSKKMFEAAQYECLMLLHLTHEDFVYLKEKKQMMMHKMEVPLNEIKSTANIDELNIKRWQNTAINKFLLAIPKRYRPLVTYTTWRSAMAYLNLFRKKP